jgi:hypothetical protein
MNKFCMILLSVFFTLLHAQTKQGFTYQVGHGKVPYEISPESDQVYFPMSEVMLSKQELTQLEGKTFSEAAAIVREKYDIVLLVFEENHPLNEPEQIRHPEIDINEAIEIYRGRDDAFGGIFFPAYLHMFDDENNYKPRPFSDKALILVKPNRLDTYVLTHELIHYLIARERPFKVIEVDGNKVFAAQSEVYKNSKQTELELAVKELNEADSGNKIQAINKYVDSLLTWLHLAEEGNFVQRQEVDITRFMDQRLEHYQDSDTGIYKNLGLSYFHDTLVKTEQSVHNLHNNFMKSFSSILFSTLPEHRLHLDDELGKSLYNIQMTWLSRSEHIADGIKWIQSQAGKE